MIGIFIAGGVVLLAIAFGIGFAVGRSSPKTGGTTPSGNNQNLAVCEALCNQWYSRRVDLCNAEADERTARQDADALRAELNAALVVAGVLAVAGAAALQVPFGWIAAIALLALALVAAAVAGNLSGLVSRADANVARREAATQTARRLVTEALQLLQAGNCPQAELDSCLNRVPPC